MSYNKPYDLAMIYAISDNNQEFFEQLISVFADTISKDNELLKETAVKGDWREVGQLAHKMKSSIGHFQVDVLKDTILQLEHYQNSSPDQLNAHVRELDRVINEVLANLKAEFPEIFNR